jgi:hypothetical protein
MKDIKLASSDFIKRKPFSPILVAGRMAMPLLLIQLKQKKI